MFFLSAAKLAFVPSCLLFNNLSASAFIYHYPHGNLHKNTSYRNTTPNHVEKYASTTPSFTFGGSGFPHPKLAAKTMIWLSSDKDGSDEGSNDNDLPPAIQRPKNEFSRVVREDVVFGTKKGRDHLMSVQANEEEREALAKRFDLPNIAKLEADLVLKNDRSSLASSGGQGGTGCIHVEGTISATLTQVCVRTNEPFDVDSDIDVVAAVRSFDSIDNFGGMNVVKTNSNKGKNNQKKRFKDKMRLGQGKQIDDLGMMELQSLLTDLDYEDDLIEDDAIYKDGKLDVGELISQMFRLKLDPYPKKPGSKPIRISISG